MSGNIFEQPKVPINVVRFYGNVEYALETISYKQISFVHSSKLNDPFDPHFAVDFDLKYLDVVEFLNKNKEDEKFGWFIQNFHHDQWQSGIDNVKRSMDQTKKTTFVFSACGVDQVSHPKDNLYMWGHYANGHRGVAIEFNSEALTRNNLINQTSEQTQIWTNDEIWIRVRYDKDVPKLKMEDAFDFFKAIKTENIEADIIKRYFGNIGSLKSENWKAENEWRLIWRNDETKLNVYRVGIADDAISNIYIGLMASPDTVERIKFETAMKWPNTNVYQTVRGKGFDLSFRKI